jgi:hypothetical protein
MIWRSFAALAHGYGVATDEPVRGLSTQDKRVQWRLDVAHAFRCVHYFSFKGYGEEGFDRLHEIGHRGWYENIFKPLEALPKLAKYKTFTPQIERSQITVESFTTKTAALQPRALCSCFVSYSHKDERIVRRIVRALRDAGVKVWFAPEQLLPGKKLLDQIQAGLQSNDKLLLVLSTNSMKSDWVTTELRNAIKRERNEGRALLFPICLTQIEELKEWTCFDPDSGRDLAVEVREYYIPDFSQVESDEEFHTKIAELVRGLSRDTVENSPTQHE